jgi:hypothetical protein
LSFDFNPIGIGTYRCLALFINEDIGEFVYEIIGKATLPAAIEVTSPLIKVEAKKKISVKVPVELFNPMLPGSLAYSHEKSAIVDSPSNDRKFKDQVGYRAREYTNLYHQCLVSTEFAAHVSVPSFFECPAKVWIMKNSQVEGFVRETTNLIPLTFAPTKPGKYPNKIVLVSKSDVRVYSVCGIGLPITREMTLAFEAVAGKAVSQDLPLENPSDELWQFKVSLTSDPGFSVPSRLSVQPKTTSSVLLEFVNRAMGSYKAQVEITNVTRECLIIYRITAEVAEPVAESTICVKCRARERFTQIVHLPPFIQSGTANVTSNVPVIDFPSTVVFSSGRPKVPFEFSVMAQRSGVAAGELRFTDVQSQFYCWFVVECQIESPLPETTLDVETEARKTVMIEIPLANSSDHDITFDVECAGDEFFGPRHFKIERGGNEIYRLLFSPLRQERRRSAISFYNDIDGEYLYLLNISVRPPEVQILRPLSAPIGRRDRVSILLENPTKNLVSFRIENTNPSSFQVISKPTFELRPHQKRPMEILYMPASVGQREEATVTFRSDKLGDFIYFFVGSGKPPQLFSPIIVETSVDTVASSYVDFVSPFPYKLQYSVLMTTETPAVFAMLGKKRSFTLSSYGETHQIPFTFTPIQAGRYRADVTVMGGDDIRWTFPIIGNGTVGRGVAVQSIVGKSRQDIHRQVRFPLVGEREDFDPSEYIVRIQYPRNYEFLAQSLTIRQDDIQYSDATPVLITTVRYLPKRPVDTVLEISVENPMGQSWKFQMKFVITAAPPVERIVMEGALNKTATCRPTIPEVFGGRTLCHAYFAPGSAGEFTVSDNTSWIEASLSEKCELPFTVVYAPTTYGKVMKGLLVVDTLEAQWTFEFIGKTPDYVPPVIGKSGRIDISPPDGIKMWEKMRSARKRNIVKDNVDFVKLARPRTTLGARPALAQPAKQSLGDTIS